VERERAEVETRHADLRLARKELDDKELELRSRDR
jgi:hypothetical protein